MDQQEPHLTAPWVWFDAGRQENIFARARRSFQLQRVPPSAQLRITCSGLYRLWINGTYAGRGPVRSIPHKKRYDVLDVSALLRTGSNALAVQVIHFRYRTALCHGGPGGLWCQLDSEGLHVETDEQWRFALDSCYNPNTNRRNGNYGIVEEYDARREEPWREVDFDDSSWGPGQIIRDGRSGVLGPRVSPWTDLVPRGVPQCAEDDVLPSRIARVAEVPALESNGEELAWFLMQQVPGEPQHTAVQNVQSLTGACDGPAVIRQPSPLDRDEPHQYCATIILDLGRELSGFGWIDVEGNEGAIVDIVFGECIEGGRVPPVRQGVQYGDRYILRQGRQRHEVYDWKGFRYMQLIFRELTEPLKLHAAGANYYRHPMQPAGAFECSDERMARIWQVGAYTQQLCTVDALMDTPWREQQQWLGDGRVQLLVLQNAFGERAIARKFVEQFAEAQDADGMIPCVSGRPGYYIVDYALWWVQAVLDVVRFDRDAEFAARFCPNVARLLDWFEPFENEDGLLQNVPGWIFIDWANIGKEGICAPLNATYYIALAAAAELAHLGGFERWAEDCRRRAERVANAFHEEFWHDARRLYVDNVVAGEPTAMFSQHTQAIAVVAGLARGELGDLMRRAVEDDNLVRTEPYFSFYLLEALGRVGLAAKGAEFVRERWGAMLEAGATSFFEEWQTSGTFRQGRWVARPRSHCHAWSAAPTAWLSRYVLGVRADTVGGPVCIEPQPCGLAWARGTVPTRLGPVGVDWRVEGEQLRVDVTAARGTGLDCREPAGFEQKTAFTINKQGDDEHGTG